MNLVLAAPPSPSHSRVPHIIYVGKRKVVPRVGGKEERTGLILKLAATSTVKVLESKLAEMSLQT